MKPYISTLTALCALLICPKSFATTWHGTITETVTSSTNPLYAVGDSFEGWYEYESETVDGQFINFIGGVSTPPRQLYYRLFGFTNDPRRGDGNGWFSAPRDQSADRLTVTNGEVSDFHWVERDALNLIFGAHTFTAIEYYVSDGQGHYDPHFYYDVRGTLTFSAPQAVNAPEAASTLLLFVLPFLAALFWRKHNR